MSLEELCSASCDSAQRGEGLQQQNVQQELSQGVSSARKRGIWAGREICIPAGCVIFPSGPAKLNPLAGLPAFLSDGWFELHLQLQSCLLYNTSGELKFLCGPHDPVQ